MSVGVSFCLFFFFSLSLSYLSLDVHGRSFLRGQINNGPLRGKPTWNGRALICLPTADTQTYEYHKRYAVFLPVERMNQWILNMDKRLTSCLVILFSCLLLACNTARPQHEPELLLSDASTEVHDLCELPLHQLSKLSVIVSPHKAPEDDMHHPLDRQSTSG